jgi:hypothetical protein
MWVTVAAFIVAFIVLLFGNNIQYRIRELFKKKEETPLFKLNQKFHDKLVELKGYLEKDRTICTLTVGIPSWHSIVYAPEEGLYEFACALQNYGYAEIKHCYGPDNCLVVLNEEFISELMLDGEVVTI